MDATDRFAELVRLPETELASALDEVALTIAAHARPPDDPLDVGTYLSRLDGLAAACAEPSAEAVMRLLFDEEGFRGASDDYYDPRNSYLDHVLDRRVGIPITLSIIVIAVGRRAGVTFAPVGMPGHFLVSHEGVLLDPFSGGRGITLEECAARFQAIHGSEQRFDPAMLERARSHDIVARMLANLRQIHLTSGDRSQLEWVLGLRALLPAATVEQKAERAGVLAALGRFDRAADVLERIAPDAGTERGAALLAKARQLRARLN